MVFVDGMMRKARSALLRRGVGLEDADDLVQQAFLNIETYRKVGSVRSHEALMVKAAINLSIDLARRQQRAPLVSGRDGIDVFDSRPGPHDVLEARLKLELVKRGLDQLSDKTRRILLARRIDELSVSEIACREAMTVAAVEKQIARGTLALMKWLDGW